MKRGAIPGLLWFVGDEGIASFPLLLCAKVRLLRNFRAAGFADDRDFDFAGELQPL